MACGPRYRCHDGPVMPIPDSYVPIDDGFAIDVRCESCGAVGEAVIDFEADVTWEDDGPLVCTECGSIGNADDLAFLNEPCPRSWYEDDDCSGVMRRLEERTTGTDEPLGRDDGVRRRGDGVPR